MKTIDGWLCPDLLSGPGNYLRRAADCGAALAYQDRRGVAVQAGGHIGTVPCWLSRHFATVYTFEPDPENFAALASNCHAQAPGRIYAAHGVLGYERGPVALLTSLKSTGQHRVVPKGRGVIPSYRIDDLALPCCDAIFLDVEGWEIPALEGAIVTIARHRPVIMAEENKRAVAAGYEIGTLERLLKDAGYAVATRVADDIVFAPVRA